MPGELTEPTIHAKPDDDNGEAIDKKLSEEYAGPDFNHDEQRELEASGASSGLRKAAEIARENGEEDVARILEKQADALSQSIRELFDKAYEGLEINESAKVLTAKMLETFVGLNGYYYLGKTSFESEESDESKEDKQILDMAWQKFLQIILDENQLADLARFVGSYRQRYMEYTRAWDGRLKLEDETWRSDDYISLGGRDYLERIIEEYDKEHPEILLHDETIELTTNFGKKIEITARARVPYADDVDLENHSTLDSILGFAGKPTEDIES